MIDETGANLGVLSLSQAKALAKEKNLDLIEVVSTAKPPVAKIMSFDKYRYQETKKLKKQRAQQKTGTMKQVQISVREAPHDLEMKAGRVNAFLKEGHVVEIQMTLRGREKGNKDFAKQKMFDFLKYITPDHKLLSPPRIGGRGFMMHVAKK